MMPMPMKPMVGGMHAPFELFANRKKELDFHLI